MRALIPVLFLALGCNGSGSGLVSGQIGDVDFSEVKTVFHGGPFVALFDREIDCIDTYWMEQAYNDAQSPAEDVDFVALQFVFTDPAQVGTFSVAGASAVSGYGLVNEQGEFQLFRTRDGTLTLTEVTDDTVVGEFQLELEQGQVNGEFESVWCRNMVQ